MGKVLFSLAFATALLAVASSEASANFVCQAVGARSVGYGRAYFVADAKWQAPHPVRAVQRNLYHQLRSGVLITGSSRAGMPLRDRTFARYERRARSEERRVGKEC